MSFGGKIWMWPFKSTKELWLQGGDKHRIADHRYSRIDIYSVRGLDHYFLDNTLYVLERTRGPMFRDRTVALMAYRRCWYNPLTDGFVTIGRWRMRMDGVTDHWHEWNSVTEVLGKDSLRRLE